MNIYAIATLIDSYSGETVTRGDASEVRASVTDLSGRWIHFTAMIGDDRTGERSDVMHHAGKFWVNFHSDAEGFNVKAECFDSLSTAMRVAHGWCIAG